MILSAIASIVVAGYVIWSVNPMEASWMPKCVFKSLSGFDCPSCGATRAIHALLHGHFLEALAYNYFLIIALIYAAAASLIYLLPCLHATGLRQFVFGKITAYSYVVLLFAWWIIRNLEWYKSLL